MISLRRFILHGAVDDRRVATNVVTYIHQNHDYRGGVGEAHEGSEARGTLVLAVGSDYVPTIEEVNWVLTEDTLKPAWILIACTVVFIVV